MSRDEEMAKRWKAWQFSLRGILLLVLLVATFFGGWKTSDWHREREMERAMSDFMVEFRRQKKGSKLVDTVNPDVVRRMELLGESKEQGLIGPIPAATEP